MMRISTFCVLSGALAAFAMFADSASAGPLTVRTTTSTVNVHTPAPKVTVPTIVRPYDAGHRLQRGSQTMRMQVNPNAITLPPR